MLMNGKKRSAPDLPLYRNPKRARTTIPAEEPKATLSEDWMSLGHNLASLSWRTVTQFTNFIWSFVSEEHPQTHSEARTEDGTTISSTTAEQPSQLTHQQRKPEATRKQGAMGPPDSRPLRTFTLSSDAASSSTAIPTPPPSDSTAASSSRTTSPTSKNTYHSTIKTGKRRVKPHILSRQHQQRIKNEHEAEKEEILKELWGAYAARGYQSDFKTFKDYLGYRQRVEMLGKQSLLRTSPSADDVRSVVASPPRSVRSSSFSGTPRHQEPSSDWIRDLLVSLTKIKHEPIPATPSHAELLEQARRRDERINQRLRPKVPPLPTALPPADDAQVTSLLSRNGVIAKYAKEQVSGTDLARLKPGSWLNDEIINFYGAMLLGRSDDSKKGASGKSLDVHYFSSFFWAKLVKDGYQNGNLARWTKKAKVDLFAKDAVLIPINHDNTHWTAAVINFKRKRIESYDSLTSSAKKVFKPLRSYLDEEHKNKKGKTFDFTGWEDYAPADTPQQENAYDCGVFTCQFLASASRGDAAFNFTQNNIPYLRRRMVWEIGNARLRDD